jgi:hypothetical protein
MKKCIKLWSLIANKWTLIKEIGFVTLWVQLSHKSHKCVQSWQVTQTFCTKEKTKIQQAGDHGNYKQYDLNYQSQTILKEKKKVLKNLVPYLDTSMS